VLRAKCLFREIDERSSTGEEELLSVSHIRGVTRRSETNATMFLAKSNRGHKICRPGDLVINTMWAWMGALGVSPHTGLVSPSYGTYRPIGRNALLAGYAHQLLRTPQYVSEYISCSTGIHASRLRLYPEQFLCIPVLRPPDEEQSAIVRFLNHATRRIAGAIRAKKKLIALLDEQKQAIIHHAVTRGLNPSALLRPSGVPWLGDIPSHWEIRRLKFLAHIKTGGRDTVDRVDNGVYPFFVRSQTVERIDTYSFDGEAVLTAGDGAGVGKVFHYVNGKFDYHQRVYKFSKFRRISGNFFFHYLKSNLRFEALDASAKSTVDSLRLPLLQNFATVVPPVGEQGSIVTWIDAESLPLDTAIARTEREIALLQEYRTRLTADIVTGKLDVREAARTLPAEVEAPEAVIAAEDEAEELQEAVADDE
jgi:type I restriction enzyme S subunit